MGAHGRSLCTPLNPLSFAAGVFFNAYVLSYIIAPRACHSFVGYLEEEAVKTYTRALQVAGGLVAGVNCRGLPVADT